MAQLGLLRAKNLLMWGHHGQDRINQMHGEKFMLDVDVWYDMEKQCKTDVIPDGISYYDIDEIVKREFNSQRYGLLQPLARKIANSIKQHSALVDHAVVTIKKRIDKIDKEVR